MIFDSEQQRNFVLDAVRKYPTNYETALNLATAFGQSIQDGRVISAKEQIEKFPLPGQPDQPAKDATLSKEVKLEDIKKVAGNGDDQTARVKGEGQDLTKGPAK